MILKTSDNLLILSASLMFPQDDVSKYPKKISALDPYGINPDIYPSLFNQNELGTPLECNISLITATKQKFTIREIFPDWCYSSEGAKVHIIRTKSFRSYWITAYAINPSCLGLN